MSLMSRGRRESGGAGRMHDVSSLPQASQRSHHHLSLPSHLFLGKNTNAPPVTGTKKRKRFRANKHNRGELHLGDQVMQFRMYMTLSGSCWLLLKTGFRRWRNGDGSLGFQTRFAAGGSSMTVFMVGVLGSCCPSYNLLLWSNLKVDMMPFKLLVRSIM